MQQTRRVQCLPSGSRYVNDATPSTHPTPTEDQMVQEYYNDGGIIIDGKSHGPNATNSPPLSIAVSRTGGLSIVSDYIGQGGRKLGQNKKEKVKVIWSS
jgi:hypothetical protein